MKNVKKKFELLNRLKWMGGLLGLVVYLATWEPFGELLAMALCFFFTTTFYRICKKESMRLLCDFVAADLKKVVQEAGHEHCIVEIKSFAEGLITRVYLVNAGARSALYGRIVLSHIGNSWYKKNVWVTQMLDVAGEGEIQDASRMLDDELYQQLKKARMEAKAAKGTPQPPKNVPGSRDVQSHGPVYGQGKIRYAHKTTTPSEKKVEVPANNPKEEKKEE